MFYLLVVVSILVFIIAVAIMKTTNYPQKKLHGTLLILGSLGLFATSWCTAQGQLQFYKFTASTQKGNWLIIDNSGGKTLRHWVLTNNYVESSNQSDGWQFYNSTGNLCYVSGDAFVMRIDVPMEGFLKTYKHYYNVPEDQEPCP